MKCNMGWIMIENLVNKLLYIYLQYEMDKLEKRSKGNKKGILPSYVTKRNIQIYNNGKLVFDSKEVDVIPNGIQYAIKSYGIPKNLRPNSKTPIVYKLNTTLSSMFPSEEAEQECINVMSKINQ